MKNRSCLVLTFLTLSLCQAKVQAGVESGEYYSIDWIGTDEVESFTVADDKSVILQAYNVSNGRQRFIGRVNTDASDHTFTLFSEVQPWNWVEHIVEASHTVRIDQTPQCLDVVGGTRDVLEGNYRNDGLQKFYVVPSQTDNPDVGLITNLQTRLCLQGNRDGLPLKLEVCNFNDVNQKFRVTQRTNGRCY